MRRMRRLLGFVVVVALVLLVAPVASAAARKPPRAVPGFSCLDADVYYGTDLAEDPWNGEGTRTVTLDEGHPGVCIDLSNEQEGSLEVTVEQPFNGVRVITAGARDSSPGDHCAPGLVLDLRKDDAGTIEGIPKATLNACGTDYSEAHFEDDDVVEIWDVDPDFDDPLAIGVGIFGKPGGPVEVTLEFTPGS